MVKNRQTLSISNLGNGIVEVQLNRPKKHNAMSFLMIDELIATAKSIKKDKSIRAVLLSGAGQSFCAGIDLNDLKIPKNRISAFFSLISPFENRFQKVSLIWSSLPIPVIAVIHGNCFGAGMQLVLGADIRIAEEKSKFSIMETRWGLIPDMGITVTLKGLVAIDKAKELCMTARVLEATEAKEIGLITYSVEKPREKALELAMELIERSPDALAGVKRILNAMISNSRRKSLALERILQLRLIIGENVKLSAKKDKDTSVVFKTRKIG